MSESGLDLLIGDMMQLELALDSNPARYVVRAIGMLAGASVLVTAPLRNGKMVPVREGQAVIMRSFARNHASAFSSRVLRSCISPYPYLHLGYPDVTQDVVVRSSRRIGVDLIGVVRSEASGDPVDVRVGDLSTSGAMLESAVPLGPIGTRLRLATKLSLDGLGERELGLDGVIRSVHPHDDGSGSHSLGVEFAQLDPLQTLTLRAFVYGQLLSG